MAYYLSSVDLYSSFSVTVGLSDASLIHVLLAQFRWQPSWQVCCGSKFFVSDVDGFDDASGIIKDLYFVTQAWLSTICLWHIWRAPWSSVVCWVSGASCLVLFQPLGLSGLCILKDHMHYLDYTHVGFFSLMMWCLKVTGCTSTFRAFLAKGVNTYAHCSEKITYKYNNLFFILWQFKKSVIQTITIYNLTYSMVYNTSLYTES